MLKEAGMISTVYAVNIGLLAENATPTKCRGRGSVKARRLPDLESQRFEGGCQ